MIILYDSYSMIHTYVILNHDNTINLVSDERDALSAQNAELNQKLASNEDSLTVILFYSIQTFHCVGVIINKKGL